MPPYFRSLEIAGAIDEGPALTADVWEDMALLGKKGEGVSQPRGLLPGAHCGKGKDRV